VSANGVRGPVLSPGQKLVQLVNGGGDEIFTVFREAGGPVEIEQSQNRRLFVLYTVAALDFAATIVKTLLSLFLLTLVSAQPLAAKSKVIAAGETVQKLVDGFEFTEGPACDAEGNVFFTDQPNDRILKWSTDGKMSTFMQPCGRANGLSFDRSGNLWACADEKNELWLIDPSKKVTVVIKNYKDKLLNGPNDLWFRPTGGLYFTDPLYKRP